jgi:VanZ family protein
VHFGYFFGGAILLSAHLFFKNPGSPSWRVIIPAVIVFIALVGALDEFHQSFIPGRSGNDLPDWLADVMGGTIGALTFKAIHRRLQ